MASILEQNVIVPSYPIILKKKKKSNTHTYFACAKESYCFVRVCFIVRQ